MKSIRNKKGKVDRIVDAKTIADNEYEYILKILKYIEIFKVDKDSLKNRERDFLAVSVLASNKGMRLYGKEARLYIMKVMKFRSKSIMDKHRISLLKKGWLKKEGHTFRIAPILRIPRYDKIVKFEFEIEKKYEEKLDRPDN